jgi:hypothetical protein
LKGIRVFVEPCARKAFSAVEIIVSTVVLALAVIPILTLVSSGQKNAAITEYHVLAQLRARRIIESLMAYPFRELIALPPAESGGVKIPVKLEASVFPGEYKNKVKNYSETLTIEKKGDGAALVTVQVVWKLATGGQKSLELQRLFFDESESLNAFYPLRQQGTTIVK